MIELAEIKNQNIEAEKRNFRTHIMSVQEKLAKLPQAECPLTHHFSHKVYARELFIPKGAILIGKIHKFENLNIISSGDITIVTESGFRRVKAPTTIVSPSGVKRLVYAHEDTVWTTIHGTDLRDVDAIEEEFIAESFDELDQFIESGVKQLEEAVWHG